MVPLGWAGAAACIGETSAQAAKKAGMQRVHHPAKPGIDGYVPGALQVMKGVAKLLLQAPCTLASVLLASFTTGHCTAHPHYVPRMGLLLAAGGCLACWMHWLSRHQLDTLPCRTEPQLAYDNVRTCKSTCIANSNLLLLLQVAMQHRGGNGHDGGVKNEGRMYKASKQGGCNPMVHQAGLRCPCRCQ